jgi:hypothetical protein
VACGREPRDQIPGNSFRHPKLYFTWCCTWYAESYSFAPGCWSMGAAKLSIIQVTAMLPTSFPTNTSAAFKCGSRILGYVPNSLSCSPGTCIVFLIYPYPSSDEHAGAIRVSSSISLQQKQTTGSRTPCFQNQQNNNLLNVSDYSYIIVHRTPCSFARVKSTVPH